MTRHPGLLIFALWAAGLGAAAQFGKISVIFQDLAQIYGGTTRTAFMVSIVGFVGLIFGTTSGIAVRRLGLRRVMLAALALGAVISAVQALILPYPLMMASRVLEGVSHLVIVVVAPAVIAQAASARYQGFAMTLWSTFFSLCYAVLALVGPPVANSYGPSGLFLAHSAYMIVIFLMLYVLMPDILPEPGQGSGPRALLHAHAEIYASPRIAAPATGFFFYTILYVAILTLLPPLMGSGRALVATAMPLVSIAVSLTLGVALLRRLSAVRLVQAGFAFAMVGGLCMGLGWSLDVLRFGGALLLAAALGIVQGASFASIPQLNASEGDRILSSGAVAQLGNLGTSTGTPLLALMISLFGPSGVATFAVPLCLGGIAVHAWQARRRRMG
ncbi:MAG: MFS transporter [Cereibacter sphaeroides]|uniref:MFS transporter n=1 Tax=Cereibacter sphaeroides TaxID=1063 RepID=A0A2W5S8J9_CERSP|nr:MAG: MFS transporter [Cereibacter sphaeroides]